VLCVGGYFLCRVCSFSAFYSARTLKIFFDDLPQQTYRSASRKKSSSLEARVFSNTEQQYDIPTQSDRESAIRNAFVRRHARGPTTNSIDQINIIDERAIQKRKTIFK
jgi:hypothetical protein